MNIHIHTYIYIYIYIYIALLFEDNCKLFLCFAGENYGDGVCDQYHLDLEAHLNTEMCSWDGGDCCISTCVTSDGTECDHLVYACLDPTASDYGDISVCNICVWHCSG